jgi:hypothetical protein
MSDCLFQCDRGEAYKGSIHLALFGLAAICAAYNTGAAVVRPSRQLTLQAGLYGLLAAAEAYQVASHWGSR